MSRKRDNGTDRKFRLNRLEFSGQVGEADGFTLDRSDFANVSFLRILVCSVIPVCRQVELRRRRAIP
jgi:hypothetical protein